MFIKQASELSGATQRAIRLYESLGLIEVARSGKYRVYTETDIKLIKMIKEAQTLGIQLSEIVSLKSGKDDFFSSNQSAIRFYQSLGYEITQSDAEFHSLSFAVSS